MNTTNTCATNARLVAEQTVQKLAQLLHLFTPKVSKWLDTKNKPKLTCNNPQLIHTLISLKNAQLTSVSAS